MALIAKELAAKMQQALGQKTDGSGAAIPTPDELTKRANGICKALKAGTFAHAGTITAIGAPGSPVTLGTGLLGVLVLSPAAMITEVLQSAVGPHATAEATAFIAYLATGTIMFPPGKITGNCTATPVSPGILAAGAGSGGRIIGINAAGAVAAMLAAGIPMGPESIPHYNAAITYILANLEGSYSSGSVTGTFAAGGGPLAAGTGIGGIIK